MNTLQKKVDSFPHWYHHIKLGDIETPGPMPISEESYKFPEDLKGKRVLDVGAWDGFWTFKALEAGASEVIAIDDFSDTVRPGHPARTSWATFDFCRRVLGYKSDRCKRLKMNIYDVSEKRLGRFDLILLYGVMYHLRYPMYGLDKLSEVSVGEIRLESAVADYYGTYRGGIGHGYGNDRIAEFHYDNTYGQNSTNWWTPTLHTLAAWVHAAGWAKNLKGWRLTETPEDIPACRGFIVAEKGTS